MDLISLIITLAVIGFVVWLVTTLVPMNDTIKKALIGLVCLIVCLWLLKMLVPDLGNFHIGKIN
jgi:hypothetical protein